MEKLAIIGASEHQLPLIRKAREKGCETHVFAWAAGDVGEAAADVFHPISITERDEIRDVCRDLGIHGICTIGSDLGNATAGYVAHALGLPCNTPECVRATTDKRVMRSVLADGGAPSPKSIPVRRGEEPCLDGMRFPLIVKPVDRSGSRGITKVLAPEEIRPALEAAYEAGFQDIALVEEYATGREFSVEGMSWNGRHRILAVTEKFTTGAPHFIETGHLQPARITAAEEAAIREVTAHALDILGVERGASHTELKLANDGTIRIIEIASRMGGDCIGSALVQLSTGIDFVGAVVDAALGREPDLAPDLEQRHGCAFVRFSFGGKDTELIRTFMAAQPSWVKRCTLTEPSGETVTDSSNRFGCTVFACDEAPDLGALGLA